jgi:hypothetical protein
MEHELGWQCSIGALGRITPEEIEEREWAFPAFGTPKKNGTVQFVVTIQIHTDHQNLTHNDTHHVNLREQCTRIFLDADFPPTFVHIKGTDNTAADGLSQLPMADNASTEIAKDIFVILPNNLDWEESSDSPLNMKRIMIAQESDNALQQRIASGKHSEIIAMININGSNVTSL